MCKFEKVHEHMVKQTQMLNKILQELRARETIPEGTILQETLNHILQQLQAQEIMIQETKQQVKQQEEEINKILQELTRIQQPQQQWQPPQQQWQPPHLWQTSQPPFQSQSQFPFNILDKIDIDLEKLEKLEKIATYLMDLYKKKDNETKI
ncbi:hypothetical protein [Bacillus methanolicus]|uniref:hypothetical protein n=1 Tax=Bacillus methanolicus TaxID=1471 RepID=UPI00054E0183|nr:hypothetical protein [Bacillus methanolicus]